MPRALRSVRLHGGQGDVIMAIHGLQALRELGQTILADKLADFRGRERRPFFRAGKSERAR